MKYATGDRFKRVADELFGGNRSELARNLEMKPQALTKYLNGESMPGGLILIRLHNLGVDINWFLTGEGSLRLDSATEPEAVSEPVREYLGRLEQGGLEEEEKQELEELLRFSEAIGELNASSSLQRALLLVYARHMGEGSQE